MPFMCRVEFQVCAFFWGSRRKRKEKNNLSWCYNHWSNAALADAIIFNKTVSTKIRFRSISLEIKRKKLERKTEIFTYYD